MLRAKPNPRFFLRRCSSSCPSTAAETEKKLDETETRSKSARMNPLGVQMISENLHSQIFGKNKSQHENSSEYEDNIKLSLNHLKRHNFLDKTRELLPEVNLKLPELKGNNLDDHFRIIADEQTAKYRKILEKLIENNLPIAPNKWNFQNGWTKYLANGEMINVDFPDDDALIFDVEGCVIEGRLPTLATAASPTAWYSWCSQRLMRNTIGSKKNSTDDLIPLETKIGDAKSLNGQWKERIIVGHGINNDRAMIKEQYYLNRLKTRFLDTSSVHIAVAGMSRPQKILKLMGKTSENNGKEYDWMKVTSHNSLRHIHQLYCGGNGMNKDSREMFITAPLSDIRANFQELVTYCSKDVLATHQVLRVILPIFWKRFPHPVTLAGMFELGETYLPVNENWERYLKNANDMDLLLKADMNKTILELANDALEYRNNSRYDPWLWDVNWKVDSMYTKKQRNINSCETSSQSEIALDEPKWYQKFHGKEYYSGKMRYSTRKIDYKMYMIPKLLRLTWDGFPLEYNETHGWGYSVMKDSTSNALRIQPRDDNFIKGAVNVDTLWEHLVSSISESKQLSEEIRKITCIDAIGYTFYRLPHLDGVLHIENPLLKDFLLQIESGILKSESGVKGERVLNIAKILLHWENMQERINNALPIWLNKDELTKTLTRSSDYVKDKFYGAILPLTVVFGMPTRRPTESTFLTTRNPSNRLGSELHSMIQTPPGYKFVGANIDLQDLSIAAMIGDSSFAGIHGCTASSWMLLQGKTDIHSYVADSIGISRDFAKMINYARIYGLDESFTENILRQFNPGMTIEETKIKTGELFAATKGVKGYQLNETGIELHKKWKNSEKKLKNETYLTESEIRQMLRETETERSLELKNVVSKSSWLGGTESAIFNRLESIARSDEPSTPVLDARISRSLEPAVVGENFMTCRVNWVVQSSAADYLHLMLVSMRWLCDSYKIDARFSISIHNEIRYIVSEEDEYRAALALQIANLLTRAMFASKLGMRDLPQSTAFLQSVDIDTVLRKEVTMDCKTPSNPNGLAKEYGIESGEALDIYEILEKTNGRLENAQKVNF
uniref:Mitochondrial DNA polymerase catalytic subunit n=1 Tax=Strigamia maritima TaxID=126957 RepID=T1IMT7_STRMM